MDIGIETRCWERLLKLFGGNADGIQELTWRLEVALDQTYPSERDPLIQTWGDMRAVVEAVMDAAGVAKGSRLCKK